VSQHGCGESSARTVPAKPVMPPAVPTIRARRCARLGPARRASPT
jgi:hypothetical protein